VVADNWSPSHGKAKKHSQKHQTDIHQHPIGGYTVFVRYALPGEKVRALIILAKPTFAVGKLQNILRLSPDRVEPFCPVYGKCGGCVLQHMSYAAQLEFKRKSVEDTFFK